MTTVGRFNRLMGAEDMPWTLVRARRGWLLMRDDKPMPFVFDDADEATVCRMAMAYIAGYLHGRDHSAPPAGGKS